MTNVAVNPTDVSPPLGPYVHGMVVPGGSRLLYISGTVGTDANGKIPSDFRSQVENTWENLIRILRANNMEMRDLVKLNSYLTRMEDFTLYNEIRMKYLNGMCPASTTVIVKALVYPELLVEVEMVAAKTQ